MFYNEESKGWRSRDVPHVMENSQQSEDATSVMDSLSTTHCSCESDISLCLCNGEVAT